MSLVQPPARGEGELIAGIVAEPEGDVGGDGGVRAAQEPPDGLAEVLALDVPEGDVHGAHRGRKGAALVARVVAVKAFVPEALVGQRVLACDERREFAVDVLAHGELLNRAGESIAGDAGVGLDADEDEAPGDFMVQQRHVVFDEMTAGLDARYFHEKNLRRKKEVDEFKLNQM